MRKLPLLGIVPIALVILAGCAAGPQRWPEYERTAESRLMVIQDRIGDGLKSGALTPNEAQTHLARLEELRGEYRLLRDRPTYQGDWDAFFRRIDQLEADVRRDLAYPPRVSPPPPPPPPVYPPETDLRIEDRIISVQRGIDEARRTGRLTPTEARDYQARLDTIRADYTRMREGRPITPGEQSDILRRLDLLESDLSRFR